MSLGVVPGAAAGREAAQKSASAGPGQGQREVPGRTPPHCLQGIPPICDFIANCSQSESGRNQWIRYSQESGTSGRIEI